MRLLICSLFLVLACPIMGQEVLEDSLNFETTVKKALSSRDSAHYYIKQAKAQAQSPYRRARVNRGMGLIYQRKRQVDSAEFWFKKNIETELAANQADDYYLEIAKSYYYLEVLYTPERRNKERVALLLKALDILQSREIEHITVAACYLDLGSIYWITERYAKAAEAWKQSLSYSRKRGYTSVVNNAYFNLGMVYQQQHKLSLAQEYYRYYLFAVEGDRFREPDAYALALKSVGLVFSEDDKLDSARYYYEKGLDFIRAGGFRNMPDDREFHEMLILNNLGYVQMKQGDFEGAEESLKKVLQANEAEHGKTSVELIRTILGLGDLYRRMEKFDITERYYERALSIAKLGEFNEHSCYNRMGLLTGMLNQWDRASAYYDSAIVVNSRSYNDDEHVYLYPIHLLGSLNGKSNVELSRKYIDIVKIEGIYAQLKELVDFYYENYDSPHVFEMIPEVLSNLYLAYSQEYDQTGNKKWMKRLWEVSEMNKAAKLRNQLKKEYSLTFSVPKELLDRQKSLKDSINLAVSRVKPGAFDSSLFVLRRKYDAFMKELEKTYPRYHALKNETNFITLEQKQATLSEGDLLLNFFEGKEEVFLLKISNDRVVRDAVSKKDLSSWINDHNRAVFKQSIPALTGPSQKIKEAFGLNSRDLQPYDRLLIVPDGLTWNLNFAALVTDNSNDQGFLGNEKMLIYHHFSSEEVYKPDTPSRDVLAFSFNEKKDAMLNTERVALRNLNASLPGTSLEVASISQLWRGNYFYADKANETTFKTQGRNYGILHLAIHGYQDENNPENSYLKFSGADSLNDGKLHAYEIYDLDLNAELAVLSACYSGQGKFVAGEGMVSLGRAFEYAGVKSLLISRWEVSDYSAPYLMKYFYQGLKEGMYKSEALRHAQVKYLANHSDQLTASPFYWSSFYILGDDSPVPQQASFSSFYYLILAVVLFVALVVYRQRKATA